MQHLSAIKSSSQVSLGVQVGNIVISCPRNYIEEVIRIKDWATTPAAPNYVLGTISRDGEIYTLLDAELLLDPDKSMSPSKSAEKTEYAALAIKHPDYYRFIIAGSRATSLSENEWSESRELELPKALQLNSKSAPSFLTLYQKEGD